MKRKKIITLFTVITSLSLCSCNPVPNRSHINGDGSKDKQNLLYTLSDLKNHSIESHVEYTPSIGNPKLLVIPIWFNDSDQFIDVAKKDEIRNDINSMVFGESNEVGWNSIKSFYQAESYGLCNIEGTTTNWYDSGKSFTAIRKVEDVDNIVTKAVNAWKNANPELVKEYDTDHNGYLDGVICVYGCPYYAKLPNPYSSVLKETMWAFTSWSSKAKDVDSPNVCNYIWGSYYFMYNPDCELTIDTHTFIHETGHLFGLDDYYDYNDVGIWAGGYSMQDYNVGGHDPYSMMALGWAKPYVPTETSTVTLRPFESSGDVLLLTCDFTGSPFDEYVLVEYYSPTGVNKYDSEHTYVFDINRYPTGPTNNGIRIWHVDSRLLMKDKSDYYLTTAIEDGYLYTVGPRNTTYVSGGKGNNYATAVESLRPYKLLEMIRNGDREAEYTNYPVNNQFLFNRGDTFSVSEYGAYFKNYHQLTGYRFNNGTKMNLRITIDTLTNEEATIKVEL